MASPAPVTRKPTFRFSRSNSGLAKTNGVQVNGNAQTSPKNTRSHSSDAMKTLRDVLEQIENSAFAAALNPALGPAILDAIRHKDAIDDRNLLLERALAIVSKIDDDYLAQRIRRGIIKILYNDLSHPSSTSLSNKHAWRTPDGSNNNIDMPDFGKAGAPYSRSVQQGNPLPRNQLPDAGLVFDTLLKREGFVQHPGGLSSLMFAFAALVIHSIFRTKHDDMNINETSSYVDLAPLYGNGPEMQDKIRIRDKGRGLLHPDAFAEDRLLLLPPAVCTLLVLFNRNHNYIAAKLLEINERGTFKNPPPTDKKKRDDQDNEIFQTARLINCGWFGSVVFSDYFSTILGLVRNGSSWSLEPFEEIRNEDHSLFERGRGNSCSVEFNCLYRWHATTSQLDEQWTQDVFNKIFAGKSPEEITHRDFQKAEEEALQSRGGPSQWTFGKLERQPNDSFKDDDLANILHNATESPAAAFRARGTPSIMRPTEIMGIEANRKWGVCSLNDFRRFLGLKAFTKFSEWNENSEIADAAEKLYGNIEYLELYVGLQAEQAKPLVDGAGLCPGYTISRAILSDAIALTRGDRYFTHDFTPFNLTSWGFADCQRDPKAFGFGSTLGRLFLRTLPDHFTENSVYAFFPLMTRDSMEVNLRKLNVLGQYDLARPTAKKATEVINTHAAVASILKDKEGFIAPYRSRVDRVLKENKGFYPVEGEEEKRAVLAVLNSPDLVEQIGKFFYDTTRRFIASESYTLVGGKISGVDLVRQVLRVVPIYWVAIDLAGIELKTKDHHHDSYTAAQLFDILGDIYSFIFLDVEASRVMVLEETVKKQIHDLLHKIKAGLSRTVGKRASFLSLFSKPRTVEHREILKRLYELGHSDDQLANTILALMVTSSVELTLTTTKIVDLYLGNEHVKDIAAIAKATDKKAELDAYVLEALRLHPPFPGVYRISSKDQTVNGREYKKGDRVFLDTKASNVDATVFKNPNAVDTARSNKDRLYADGAFSYLGETLTLKIVGEVIRAVFSLDGISRAPGQSGELTGFKDETRCDISYGYLNNAQLITPWPTYMSILFNAPQK